MQTPWIHPAIDQEIQDFFNVHGRYLHLKQGAAIFNGGDKGEIALVLSGYGIFSYSDKNTDTHIFSLLPRGRLMGDVDGLTGEAVNVLDTAFRPMEVRYLQRSVFTAFLLENPLMMEKHTRSVISGHESDMEGMIANFTLPLEERMVVLYASLAHNLGTRKDEKWIEIPIALRMTEIQQFVSSSRQSVSTIHSRWEKQGLVYKENKRTYVSADLISTAYDWVNDGARPGGRVGKRRLKSSDI